MRKNFSLVMAVFLALAMIGCDSADPFEPSQFDPGSNQGNNGQNNGGNQGGNQGGGNANVIPNPNSLATWVELEGAVASFVAATWFFNTTAPSRACLVGEAVGSGFLTWDSALYCADLSDGRYRINLSGLPNGQYLVNLRWHDQWGNWGAHLAPDNLPDWVFQHPSGSRAFELEKNGVLSTW